MFNRSIKRQENALNTWVITGANGNLGKRMISELSNEEGSLVRAIVRSQSAATTIQELPLSAQQRSRLDVHICDYTDREALSEAFKGYSNLVHLVGILKETAHSTYLDAHERSCEAISDAARDANVSYMVYLSIVGSHSESHNRCLASKGNAEQIVINKGVDSCVLRVPMVLGEQDYASTALYYRALKPFSLAFRASSLEQPIYAGDVLKAIRSVCRNHVRGTFDLAGPEVLTREALVQKAAGILGRSTRVISLPIWLGSLIARFLEVVMSNPPITPAMLGVLDHDDDLDSLKAIERIGLQSLTPLERMLELVFQVIPGALIKKED